MPAIWNSINGGYNTDNNKKISSKLTFNVGEKFSGKVSKKGDGNEVTVKLLDGWEFDAEIDGDLEGLEQGFKRFEVVGYKDGKLKLKLVNNQSGSSNNMVADDEIGDIINKEGLEKADANLLKAMLKYDIPLSKDNIRKIKSLIDISVRVNNNPEEIDKFIEKYLQGKNIDGSTQKGQEIKALLKEFLNTFKGMSKEDILLFIENDIEFSKGNIEGYNKLNSGELTSKGLIENIKKQCDDLNLDIVHKEILSGDQIDDGINNNITKADVTKNENSMQKEAQIVKDSNIQVEENKTVEYSKEKALNSYEVQGNKNEKIDILGLLKSLAGKSDDSIKSTLKDIINIRKDDFTVNNFKNIMQGLESLDEDLILNKLLNNNSDISDSIKDINTTSNINNISKDSIEKVLSNFVGNDISLTEDEFLKLKDFVALKVNSNGEITSDESIDKTIVNKEIVNKDINSKDNIIPKDVVIKENTTEKSEVLLKNNISWEITDGDEALVNKDIKAQVVKTTVDMISDNKGNTAEIVKDSIKDKAMESKDVLKNLLNTLKSGGEVAEKLAGVIKNSINEINILNKISNEYYYMDTPVKIRDHEYPCKLIVKDDRKSGKKIDSTNIRMVVTVKTINLGTVDGYLRVKDKNIDLELKSEEQYINTLANERQKLIDNISKLGFNINVKVTKKEEEATLTNCREFFKDDNRLGIDFKV